MQTFFLMFLFLWIIYLISLLGNTASNYFTPTLGNICVKLNLSYSIAGVTFLAFGNGAPDVFSTFFSVTGNADVLVGVGALLGGSVFISTVVVGCVSIFCPCQVTRYSFLRDIGFHLLAIILITAIAIQKVATLTFSLILLGTYFCYCGFIVFANLSAKKTAHPMRRANAGVSGAQIQAAFWHKSSKPKVTESKAVGATVPEKSFQELKSSESIDASNGYGYKFLILDEERGQGTTKTVTGVTEKPGEDEDEGETTINLSGGLISSEFDAEIMDDYMDRKLKDATSSSTGSPMRNDNSLAAVSPMKKKSRPKRIKNEGSRLMGALNAFDGRGKYLQVARGDPNLTQSLLESDGDEDTGANDYHEARAREYDDDGDSDIVGETEDPGLSDLMHQQDPASQLEGFTRSIPLQSRTRYHNSIRALYWQQLLLRRRVQNSTWVTGWWSLPIHLKIFVLLDYPAVFARDLTIPTVDTELWFKVYAISQPLTCPLFILFVFGYWGTSVGALPTPLFVFLIGLPFAAVLLLTTHVSYPPNSAIFGAVWVLIAFVMCVVWVYLLAGELVCCLTTAGDLFNIPPAYLGLTVLAWGNCMGK